MLRSRTLVISAVITMVLVSVYPHCAMAKKKSEKSVVVELPPLKGPKKTISVLSFENKSNYSAFAALGSEFSEMLVEALMKTEQFILVARQELGAVITEQDLAATGRFAASKTAEKGKLIPSQIIIKGAVTEFESSKSGGGADVSFGGFGAGTFGLSGESTTAHVAVIVYIIDSATGEILDSQRVEGNAKASGMGFDWAFDGNYSFGTSGFSRTPLGKATQQTIYKAVSYIAKGIADIPWSGSIVKVEGNTIFLNAGANAGIAAGDLFAIYREDEALTDPITGASLGAEKAKIGEIVVNEVKDKYSKAKIVGCTQEVKRGDLVLEN